MSSTYNATSTGEDVAASLSRHITGKTIVITGPSPGGLGAEFARVVALHAPALLILAGRNESKLAETEKAVSAHGVKIQKVILDLSDLDQIPQAVEQVKSLTQHIDVFVNNAGIMACPYAETKQGHESQFGTNHLGHFKWTTGLLPLLLPGGRVVNVSSVAHRFAGVNFNDLTYGRGKHYQKWPAYGQAKSANILFTIELAELYKNQGLTAFSLHPGGIVTQLQQHLDEEDRQAFPNAWNTDGTINYASGIWKTLAQGTSTHVRASFDPSIVDQTGSYLVDCNIANDQVEPHALDKNAAKRLWELSEKLTAY